MSIAVKIQASSKVSYYIFNISISIESVIAYFCYYTGMNLIGQVQAVVAD